MRSIALNRTNFVETVSRRGVVVVDCWAPWCRPGEQFSPALENVARRYPDVICRAVRINGDKFSLLLSDKDANKLRSMIAGNSVESTVTRLIEEINVE